MVDQATERMIMRATPTRCFEVVTDFERYPEWAADIKAVQVVERDDQGRPTEVAFRAAAFGRSTSYTLQYDYAAAPNQLSWVQIRGDYTSKLDGVFCSTRSSGVRPYSACIHSSRLTIARCGTTTPFGRPVEPDV